MKKNDADKRLDRYLLKALCGLPQSLLYKYLRTKRIKLNGKKADPGTLLAENDVIELYIPEEFFGEKPQNRCSFRKIGASGLGSEAGGNRV